MIKKNRLMDRFEWIPKHQRNSRFGGPVAERPVDNKMPVFWLDSDQDDIYFINNSDDTLDYVIYSRGAMQTLDDDVMSVSEIEECYEQVLPGEAVKIYEYDVIFDSDFVIIFEVRVISKQYDDKIYLSEPFKGRFKEMVLLWDNGESR